jgi:hypothetical protein
LLIGCVDVNLVADWLCGCESQLDVRGAITRGWETEAKHLQAKVEALNLPRVGT